MAFRHVLPNIGSMLIVQASVSFAIAILAEAALSFLGFGTRPPTPSWGAHAAGVAGAAVLHAAPGPVARPGHRAGRARLQPARRRPARLPRPQAQEDPC
ncbi:hypothetical protein ACFSTC_31310 [Nonomuraea ferruginea]